MIDIEQLKSTVPIGRSGDWSVDKFTITEDGAKMANMKMTFGGFGYRFVTPGEYTRLSRNNKCIMSDTRAEIRDHIYFISDSKGDVLIHGLGLGIVALACAGKSEVKSMTVIEKSQDVINLVSEHVLKQSNKIRIICADAFTWEPDMKFDCIWSDIWDDICADNWEEMKKLRKHYRKFTSVHSFWVEYEVKRLVRQARKEEKEYQYFTNFGKERELANKAKEINQVDGIKL